MERDYIGVEIDGTDETLSKDAKVIFHDDIGMVEFKISDAFEEFTGDFTAQQFDALLDMLLAARSLLSSGAVA